MNLCTSCCRSLFIRSSSKELNKAYDDGKSQTNWVKFANSYGLCTHTHDGITFLSKIDITNFKELNYDCKNQFIKGYNDKMLLLSIFL
jgi:hypothetical protein